MPRRARILSGTGIYHVVIKGINSQSIFEDTSDFRKYLEILEYFKRKCNFELYAFCLMSNHVHLILNVKEGEIDGIFRRMSTTYALWFNRKYSRTGHLQHGRFFSEPIEDMGYLLRAIRYVHQNPLHVGLEEVPGTEYPWNSMHDYLSNRDELTDISFVLSFMTIEDFEVFNKTESGDKCLDTDNWHVRIKDEDAREIIREISGCANVTEFQSLAMLEREKFIENMRENGLSIRQISRLTGVSIGVIQRIGKNANQRKQNCQRTSAESANTGGHSS